MVYLEYLSSFIWILYFIIIVLYKKEKNIFGIKVLLS